MIGLRSDQEQHPVAFGVGPGAQLNARPAQVSDHPIIKHHCRSPRPMIQQSVGVERGYYGRFVIVEQRGDRAARAEARVDPAIESQKERRVNETGVFFEGIQRVHRPDLSAAADAAATRLSIDAPNSSASAAPSEPPI